MVKKNLVLILVIILFFSGCTLPAQSVCGDNVCENEIENNSQINIYCEKDCGNKTTKPLCGDGICTDEIESNPLNDGYCSADCGPVAKQIQINRHQNNLSDSDRINLVWFYFNSESEEESFENIKKVFERLLDFEPFKSNKDKFNFLYVGNLRTVEDSASKENYGSCQNTSALEIVQVLMEKNRTLAGIQGAKIPLITTNLRCTANNWENYARESLYRINGEIHELGHFFGHLYDESGLRPGYEQGFGRNCQETYEGAIEQWGNLIGNGCGEKGIIDCDYQWGLLGDNFNEVAVFTGKPENCFELGSRGTSLKENCFFTYGPTNAGVKSHKAMEKNECIEGEWCMYYESEKGSFMCKQEAESTETICPSEGIGCGYQTDGFRATLSSVMMYHYPYLEPEQAPWLSFGEYNELIICNRLYQMTGKTICPIYRAYGTTEKESGKDFIDDFSE